MPFSLGIPPSIEAVVEGLIVRAWDAQAVTMGDPLCSGRRGVWQDPS